MGRSRLFPDPGCGSYVFGVGNRINGLERTTCDWWCDGSCDSVTVILSQSDAALVGVVGV